MSAAISSCRASWSCVVASKAAADAAQDPMDDAASSEIAAASVADILVTDGTSKCD